MRKTFSLTLSLVTIALILFVGFAEAYTTYSTPNYNYSPYNMSTCDECGKGSSETHYTFYSAKVVCPDCGDTYTTQYNYERNGSSSCSWEDSGVTRTTRCSTCEIINNIMEILIPPPKREPYNPPPIPPDTPRREPTGYAFVPHDSLKPSVAAGDDSPPELLRLLNLFTPRENQRGDIWLDGWNWWYNGNPAPRKELPEDLKFRIENEVGINV